MATGALIRNFEKDYRELRYSNSGSISLSEIEHNAYRAALTLEITHVDAPRYGSRKTLPDNTHYGYVTLFRGSTVTDTIAIKYPKFRVFDIRNQGIWNYHQLTESTQINAGVSVAAANASSSGILDKLGDASTGIVCFIIGVETVLNGGESSLDFVLDLFDCDDPNADERNIARRYRAFPIATPFPDIAKFKADIPCSFLWRLELWYLVNPAVYIADNPTDTGDETEGEDEYPEPEQGDGDGDGDEFPEPDPAPPDSDPRDFGRPFDPGPPPPFEGGQCDAVYRLRINFRVTIGSNPPLNLTSGTFTVAGPITGIGFRSSSPAFGGGAGIVADTADGPVGLAAKGQATEIEFAGIALLERVDGQSDNCGNPPPIPVE